MKKDLTNKTFGHLYVVGVADVSRNGHYRYHVKCSCGVEKTVLGTHLLQGNTTQHTVAALKESPETGRVLAQYPQPTLTL